jgi:hypothetical protein
MAATDIASYNNTLVAATEDTVNIGRDCDKVRVYNDTGTAAIFFTTDGTAATVNGANCYRVPADAGAYTTVSVTGASNTKVRLISSGTPTYSVEGS